MGRRKWKLYQETHASSHLNSNATTEEAVSAATAASATAAAATAATVTASDSVNTNQIPNALVTDVHCKNNGQQEHNNGDTLFVRPDEHAAKQQANSFHTDEHNKQNSEQLSTASIAENQTRVNEIGETGSVKRIDGDDDDVGDGNNTTTRTPAASSKTTVASGIENNLNAQSAVNSNGRDDEIESPPLPTPIDWKPQENCYFCVDGKLLTVNDKGDLVAESGSVHAGPDLARRAILESDSDSSDCSEAGVIFTPPNKGNKSSVADLLRATLPQQPNMTSLESMAAQLATIASLNGFPPIYPGLLYNPFVQQMHSNAAAESTSADSPVAKPSSSPVEAGTTEQPLDLSAKPSTTPSPFSNDPKQIYRAKPRMSATPSRKTYTEDELQHALQDILSGKLGTRRAAVLYGIPRSTLRNKVYKLAMEQKREASLLIPQSAVLDALDAEDDDKELSGGEDDKEMDKLNRIMLGSADDLSRLSSSRSSLANSSALQKYSQLMENNSIKNDKMFKDPNQPMNTASTPPMGAAAVANNPWLDPMMFQNLMLASGLMQQKFDDPAFHDLFRNLLIQQELIKEQLKNSVSSSPTDHVNNGKASDSRNAMHNLSVLQQQQQIQNRLMKIKTPDSVPPVDLNDSEDSAVILKIPSFKPVAGSSSSSSGGGKNGDNAIESPQTTPPLHSRSPHLSAGLSPPIGRQQNNDSQSPPMNALGQKGMLSLRDVIAKSITRTFNQQNPEMMSKPSSMDQLDQQYKRPSISVIKNLGGTDISRFATSPNMISSMRPSNSVSPNSLNNSGKGTRPKRGKYRNYDRDSLVEAVKAVQRGEMSVHRAGSYYGVPHSTLEYKVKERHLMRPRKREPKPQPLDSSGGSTSSTASLKVHDVHKTSSKNVSSAAKQPMKTPPFPATTSPNGMKMGGIFDPSQIQYPPHLFWPHPPGYSGLTAPFSSGNADTFFASQMMQRFQEDAMRQSNNSASNKTGTTPGMGSDLSSAATGAAAAAAVKAKLTNNDRESSLENLYEGGSANGSFLDGIIRYSLDRKTSDSIPQGALLDQLVKNNRNAAAMSSDRGGSGSDIDASNCQKRPGSPFNFTAHAIKRERTSSSSGETDRDSTERDIPKDSLETLLKYNRERPKSSAEELNGASGENNKHTDNDENSS